MMSFDAAPAVPNKVPRPAKREKPPVAPKDESIEVDLGEINADIAKQAQPALENQATRLEGNKDIPEVVSLTRKKKEGESGANEDQGVALQAEGVMFVADGLGGTPGGDKASRIAANMVTNGYMDGRIAGAQGQEKTTWENIRNVMGAASEQTLDQGSVEKAMTDLLTGMSAEVASKIRGDVALQEEALQMAQDSKDGKAALDAVAAGAMTSAQAMEKIKTKARSLLETVGTTGSLLKRWRGADGKDRVTMAQVGDSRIYRLRGGKVEQMSQDDSIERLFTGAGISSEAFDKNEPIDLAGLEGKLKGLTSEQSNTQPYDARSVRQMLALVNALKSSGIKNITPKMLGGRNMMFSNLGASDGQAARVGFGFEPAMRTEELQPEDTFVGVSDGVCDNLSPDVIQRIAGDCSKDGKMDTRTFTRKLVDAAKIVGDTSANADKAAAAETIRQGFKSLGLELSQVDANHLTTLAKPDDTTAVVMKF